MRGEDQSNEIKIPRQTDRVRFRIKLLPNDYKTYSASLSTVEGDRPFVQNNLRARPSKSSETLIVEVPAKRLSLGLSVLTLTGTGPNGASEDVGKDVIRIVST
jgi:hypothetical protein